MAGMTCDGHPSRFGRVLVLPNGSPFIVTGYQPSDSIILITSRTFMALDHRVLYVIVWDVSTLPVVM